MNDRIAWKQVMTTYQIHLDGKWYRVTHRSATDYTPATRTHHQNPWRVFASRGAFGERECDPEKPTFKRVVAWMKSQQEHTQ